MLLTLLTGSACAAWAALLLLPSQPHRTRERLEPVRCSSAADTAPLHDVAVLIPARNEADLIGRTLAALARQGEGLAAVVVDDRSTDATAAICRAAAVELCGAGDGAPRTDRAPLLGGAAPAGGSPRRLASLEVVAGAEPPPGWSGKLWALEQGLGRIDRRYTLLLDADIELAPGVVAALIERAGERGAALVSLMATLRCVSFWERLLVPPFVYFFKLIYPFARVNSVRAATAAAAGGCILIETRVLREIGLAEIRGALIDDCALARAVKRRGYRIWLGLSRSVRSLRPYARFGDFSLMVKRTAFTQLRYSAWLLLGVTLAMSIVFVLPFVSIVTAPARAPTVLGLAAAAAMYASFVPIARFYKVGTAWIATLPIAAALFVWMTWASALGYWRGTTARWKNRAYVPEHE